MKICLLCGREKDEAEFHTRRAGRLSSRCKQCQQMVWRRAWKEKPDPNKLYAYARERARNKGLAFDITPADIVIPPICPILGIPMTRPSLDRIDSSRGYTKDNVQVISFRANTLKNNASVEEMRLICTWLERTIGDKSTLGGQHGPSNQCTASANPDTPICDAQPAEISDTGPVPCHQREIASDTAI